MKYEKSCGAVVYKIEDGKLFFLVEHMVQGHISIPKGHVEGNETEEETALREIREETGLEVALDTVFRHDVSYSPEPGVEKKVIFFCACPTGGVMKNQEIEVSALEWLPYDQAIEAVTYDTDKEVLAHASVYLSKLINPFEKKSSEYTKWQREFFDPIPADQLHAEAVAYAEAHPYQGKAKEIIK